MQQFCAWGLVGGAGNVLFRFCICSSFLFVLIGFGTNCWWVRPGFDRENGKNIQEWGPGRHQSGLVSFVCILLQHRKSGPARLWGRPYWDIVFDYSWARSNSPKKILKNELNRKVSKIPPPFSRPPASPHEQNCYLGFPDEQNCYLCSSESLGSNSVRGGALPSNFALGKAYVAILFVGTPYAAILCLGIGWVAWRRFLFKKLFNSLNWFWDYFWRIRPLGHKSGLVPFVFLLF